jgi:choline dehydrogenase-like flavoprotein
MKQFEYIIVGAGPAGCVLASRLSEDPKVDVLLIEAGDRDSNPLIAIPRGFAELLGDPTTAWHFPTRPFGPSQRVEYWVRGKTLGGSSSVNGMVYNRGNRADYDALERLGNPGWGWDAMLPVFKTIEDNELGASEVRGAAGPLHVSTIDGTDPLLEELIHAGTERAIATRLRPRCFSITLAHTSWAAFSKWRTPASIHSGATSPRVYGPDSRRTKSNAPEHRCSRSSIANRSGSSSSWTP